MHVITPVVFHFWGLECSHEQFSFLRDSCHGDSVITGEQLRDARSRAGLSQEDLAKAVGVTLRSIGNWERGAGVPRNREGRVRDVLGDLAMGEPSVLSGVSDMALLAEVARRMDRGGQRDAGTAEAQKNDELATRRATWERENPGLNPKAAQSRSKSHGQLIDDEMSAAGEESQDPGEGED